MLWSHCWRRSTQMSGSGWQNSGSQGTSLCLVWRRCTHRAHLLAPWREQQLSNESASACVPGVVPTHIVMTQILSTIKCCALSCPHDLESGVLSDTHVDRPCRRRRTDAAVTAEMPVLAPPRGPYPQDSPACRKQKTTQPRRQGLMAGAGQAEGPLV